MRTQTHADLIGSAGSLLCRRRGRQIDQGRLAPRPRCDGPMSLAARALQQPPDACSLPCLQPPSRREPRHSRPAETHGGAESPIKEASSPNRRARVHRVRSRIDPRETATESAGVHQTMRHVRRCGRWSPRVGSGRAWKASRSVHTAAGLPGMTCHRSSLLLLDEHSLLLDRSAIARRNYCRPHSPCLHSIDPAVHLMVAAALW